MESGSSLLPSVYSPVAGLTASSSVMLAPSKAVLVAEPPFYSPPLWSSFLETQSYQLQHELDTYQSAPRPPSHYMYVSNAFLISV